MFQTTRQAMRTIALTVGFLLFFIVTIHAAQSARSREAVEGKHLMPNFQVATSGEAGSATAPGTVVMATVSAVSPEPNTASGSTVTAAATPDRTKNKDTVVSADSTEAAPNPGKHRALGHTKRD